MPEADRSMRRPERHLQHALTSADRLALGVVLPFRAAARAPVVLHQHAQDLLAYAHAQIEQGLFASTSAPSRGDGIWTGTVVADSTAWR